MRVLQILPSFGAGGAERMVVHLMRSLCRRLDVEAISLYSPVGTDLEAMLANEGIRVHYLGKQLGFDPRMYPAINRVIKTFRPDVVHTHRYVLRYALPSLLVRQMRVVVHTVHSVAEKEVDPLGKWVHRIAFALGVMPVAIAEDVAASITRVYRIKECPLIPNGVPVDAYSKAPGAGIDWRRKNNFDSMDVLFVCVARLSPPKNHLLLLEAFARGPAHGSGCYLLLVGDGELRRGLEARVNALGLSDKVRFLGLRTDVADILAAADVFVLASKWEGNPLSVMEAMAAGKPVICTSVGGVPELIDHETTGILVPTEDVDAMASAMTRLHMSAELRQRLGKFAAKRAAERFDVSLMVRAYEDLYQRLLATS